MGDVVSPFDDGYRGKKVLVTGITGFKGSWLGLWLTHIGAEVSGFANGIPTSPSHFELLGLLDRVDHHVGDIRDLDALGRVVDECEPDIVFHLAAQALVRPAYDSPVETFETNTMGTINVLECLRTRPDIRAAVIITSDKAYRNDEVCWGYRETDALGGYDPYSSSKACAELAAHAYHRSFLRHGSTRMATTRAGNVIGGGDWAVDRIVPDCVRAWSAGEAVEIRSPNATRPWQHVLEPLSGYLWLGAGLVNGREHLDGEPFNFGPNANVVRTVGELLTAMADRWPGADWRVAEDARVTTKEAGLLKLSCDKALHYLDWRAVLDFDETMTMTVDWYRRWLEAPDEMEDVGRSQIDSYTRLARERGLAWAGS